MNIFNKASKGVVIVLLVLSILVIILFSAVLIGFASLDGSDGVMKLFFLVLIGTWVWAVILTFSKRYRFATWLCVVLICSPFLYPLLRIFLK